MKRVLIISPYFPPANTADMQRIRMSLPYFEKFGWEAEVITVDERYYDVVEDKLLLNSVPPSIKIHKIKALPKEWTSKLGLGSLALRSLWHFRKKGAHLLKQQKFDLIYFSTTEFPICILGAYWKKKFGIPYVIDMQDPWHTDYYQNKPKAERPKKYWFSYRLHKFLEPKAMKKADGLISVSATYIKTLHERYPILKTKPFKVITFGAFDIDFKIAKANSAQLPIAYALRKKINLVYIGRGGHDMKQAVHTLFSAFKEGLVSQPALFSSIHLHFIGTSYAPKSKGIPTISPIAAELGIAEQVTEYTDRIGFYESIKNLQHADGLIIIGSNQAAYTASKLYPYILAKKPLLAIVHPESSVLRIISDCNAGFLIPINQAATIAEQTLTGYLAAVTQHTPSATDWSKFEVYTASSMTKKQVALFNSVIE
ncbi:glycosyltransferase [Pedobacter sp. KLB.chiD]|uniref:glycosyltransferase n=1 Tax=Pedobacter sp. KLB.chiD TaxID=3387402 RepID=UPI0039996ED5